MGLRPPLKTRRGRARNTRSSWSRLFPAGNSRGNLARRDPPSRLPSQHPYPRGDAPRTSARSRALPEVPTTHNPRSRVLPLLRSASRTPEAARPAHLGRTVDPGQVPAMWPRHGARTRIDRRPGRSRIRQSSLCSAARVRSRYLGRASRLGWSGRAHSLESFSARGPDSPRAGPSLVSLQGLSTLALPAANTPLMAVAADP